MSDGITEDHWKWRYEKLECRMEEMFAKKDEEIVKLKEKVDKLEVLLTNAINQIKVLTLERNSARDCRSS